MEEKKFSSPNMAKEFINQFGDKAKTVRIDMRHADEVQRYILKIEEAHEKAASSKLSFC